MSTRIIVKRMLTAIITFFSKKNIGRYGIGLHVNFPSRFTKMTEIGDYCHFNGMRISGNGRVTIGDHFHSGKRIRILTTNHNYDKGSLLPYDDTVISKDITIEDNVWLGEGVVILGGVTIGEGAVIQAYSVVTKDIPKLAVAGGHPAVVFKYRDEKHYYKLKEQSMFAE